MQEESKTMESNLRDIYYVLFRHKWKMVVFFIVVVTSVTIWTASLPDFYESDAKFLLKLTRMDVSVDPRMTVGQDIEIRPTGNEINTEVEIIRSRKMAERIVDAIGVEVILNIPGEVLLEETSIFGQVRGVLKNNKKEIQTDLDKPEKVSEKINDIDKLKAKATSVIMNNLNVQIVRNSPIISVTYQAGSPELAYEVISKLIDIYPEMRNEIFQTSGSREFLTEQSDSVLIKLGVIEGELRAMENRLGVASFEDGRSNLTSRISALKIGIESAETDLAVSRSKETELEKMLKDIPAKIEVGRTTGDNFMYTQLMQKLFDLQQQKQDLLTKYTEESRIIKNINQLIAETIASLSSEDSTYIEITQGMNEDFQEVQKDLLDERANSSSLLVRIDVLKQRLKKAQEELTELNENEFEMVRLQREKELLLSHYNEYEKSLEKLNIDQAVQDENMSKISIIQEARFPYEKSGPQKKRNVFAGFFFGFFGSIGLAFVLEYLDNTIRTPEDVRKKLNLDTLVVIADCPQKKGTQIN